MYTNRLLCLLTLSTPNLSDIRQGGKNSRQSVYKLQAQESKYDGKQYFNMPRQRRTQMSFMANYLFYGPPLMAESNFELNEPNGGVRRGALLCLFCLFTGCEVF